MALSNDGLIAFHYRSYGTFFLQQNRLHNIYRGFTHYKYYRAKINSLIKRRWCYHLLLIYKHVEFFYKQREKSKYLYLAL